MTDKLDKLVVISLYDVSEEKERTTIHYEKYEDAEKLFLKIRKSVEEGNISSPTTNIEECCK